MDLCAELKESVDSMRAEMTQMQLRIEELENESALIRLATEADHQEPVNFSSSASEHVPNNLILSVPQPSYVQQVDSLMLYTYQCRDTQ